ncbi:MAG TPA: homocysteine S-methyltransferase [Pseudolysinimonas sp.]
MDAALTDFASALATGPVILDGGLGTLLDARGNDVSSDLWSARILIEDPGEVRHAHAEFFAAGAQVATTASYQVSYEGLAAIGRDTAETDDVLLRSVRLAAEARDDAPGGGWVAASVGPYGATLADGSEYRGDDGLTVAKLRAWHRRRLRVLADGGPDVIAIETITRLAEIEALAAELEGLGAPAWISVTVSDGALRTGESLHEAFSIATGAEGVVAIGVNCCDASEVSGALAVARDAGELPTLAYPNSGELWDAGQRTWIGTPELPSDLVRAWAAEGTALIGGCCRIGPDEISAIARLAAGFRR